MTITTKTGDKGQTTCGNRRVDKDDLLVDVIGEVDELESVLELVDVDKRILDDLRGIMGLLGAQALDDRCRIKNKIKFLEEEIEKENINLEKFLNFKTQKARELNWARAVTRRVERRLVSLSKRGKMDGEILIYFNRLSDYLFIKAVKNN